MNCKIRGTGLILNDCKNCWALRMYPEGMKSRAQCKEANVYEPDKLIATTTAEIYVRELTTKQLREALDTLGKSLISVVPRFISIGDLEEIIKKELVKRKLKKC